MKESTNTQLQEQRIEQLLSDFSYNEEKPPQKGVDTLTLDFIMESIVRGYWDLCLTKTVQDGIRIYYTTPATYEQLKEQMGVGSTAAIRQRFRRGLVSMYKVFEAEDHTIRKRYPFERATKGKESQSPEHMRMMRQKADEAISDPRKRAYIRQKVSEGMEIHHARRRLLLDLPT